MEEKLEWTPARFTSEERIKLAERILIKLKSKYTDQLIAVTIEGSTAKGIDKPYSDLEMTAIMSNDFYDDRWYAFICDGMFVGIGYDPIDNVFSAAKTINSEWCIAGDRFLTAKFIYDPTNIAEMLMKCAKEAIDGANFKQLAKEAFADMYEHVLKIVTIDDDNSLAAAHNARGIAHWATMTIGLINKKQFLSSQTLYQEAKELKLLPNDYSGCIDELLSLNTNIFKLRKYSLQLWNIMVQWLSQFQISLDDEDLKGI